jgi:hypothetical protein
MRFDRWYRIWATLCGAGPKRTTIRVQHDTLVIKHGWMFRIDVPVADITSARHMPARPRAWGVHPMGDAWMVNGSQYGIVELKFARPVTSKTVQLMDSTWGEVRSARKCVARPNL